MAGSLRGRPAGSAVTRGHPMTRMVIPDARPASSLRCTPQPTPEAAAAAITRGPEGEMGSAAATTMDRATQTWFTALPLALGGAAFIVWTVGVRPASLLLLALGAGIAGLASP